MHKLFFGCLVFSVVPYTIGDDTWHIQQYVQLLSDIQSSFRSSSVFIVNSGRYEDLLQMLLMTHISKEFSRKYVLSQTISFTKLDQEVEYYNGRSVQPLFVIILTTVDDVQRFAATTRLYNMSLHTWFVMFIATQKNKWITDYCRNPQENLFNLVVTTKMLVMCPGDSLLREWYSIDQRLVEVFNYGKWTPERGIARPLIANMYERRNNLKGLRLKVSSVKDSTVISGSNGTMSGFFGIVFEELSKIMNFTIELTSVENTYGSWDARKQKWTGVIGRLAAREIDVGIGEFTMSKARKTAIDFTVPVMLTYSDIYIKRPNMASVEWSAYIKAFHIDIWILIAVTLLITPILLAAMTQVVKGSGFSCYLVDEYLHIWGIYCQKPLPDFPEASSMRIAYISILTSSLVLFAIYSAYLTSYLTVFTPVIPFNTFEGFVADGTYKLTILRHSSYHDLFTRSKISIFSEMGKLLKTEQDLPLDIYEAIRQVCNENVVLYTNQIFIEKISSYSPCVLMSLSQGRLDSVGLALVKESPYTEIINYNLKNLRALGIIECLKRRHLKKVTFVDSSYLPVDVWEVLPILGILALGAVLSLQLLICECIVSRHSRYSAIKRNRQRIQAKYNQSSATTAMANLRSTS